MSQPDMARRGQIAEAAKRGVRLEQKVNGKQAGPFIDWLMDLSVSNDGCPMGFARLNEFDGANFAHDVGGIAKHLDRTNGQLRDCFIPRCAV